ncbi:hypothetical protein V9T40_012571 [Parthenolecanium corni]|uniref:Partial AB-hydrolase lipase domain-containing protein n=1 Tax=Parthenolecanium corni TaxID=536013 RepID=A0AAN9Y0K3_9HEMI
MCVFFPETECVKIGNYLKDFSSTEDPDTYLTPPKIIRRHGYPAEAHIIQSEDGYLSEYHRIPHGKTKKHVKSPYPVLLHHGLLCSSIDWIVNGPEKSLGYILADEGYDVWMANARGNTYSRSHVTLSPKQQEFWNFTFHEVAKYDLPAAVDYILNVTNSKKLIYIGHSLGTTTFYAFASSRPEYNSKILVHVGIAPVAMLSHTTSAFKLLLPFAKQIESFYDWYSKGAFLERDLMTSIFCKIMCGTSVFHYNVCEQLIVFKLFGKDVQQFNTALIPVLMNNMPAGTSVKNMIHCSQLIRSGKFLQYDYGLKENIIHYSSATPPAYNLSQITVPVKFYHGKNDILANPVDVKLLYQQLPKPMGCKMIDYEKWNHVDFLWAIDVNRLFNKDLVLFLRNVTQTPNFIRNTVIDAFNERLMNPAVDPPVSEFESYDHIPGAAELNKIFKDLPNQNPFSDFHDSAKNHFESNFKKVQTDISHNMNQVKRAFDDHVQETGISIKKAAVDAQASFDTSISKTKEAELFPVTFLVASEQTNCLPGKASEQLPGIFRPVLAQNYQSCLLSSVPLLRNPKISANSDHLFYDSVAESSANTKES